MKFNITPNTNIYFSKSSPLQQFDFETLHNLLEDYYSKDMTVTKVIKKYKLQMRTRDLSENLPYIEVKQKCPYDDSAMIAQLPSKNYPYIDTQDNICTVCGHQIFNKNSTNEICGCQNCEKRRQKFQEDMYRLYSKHKSQRLEYSQLSVKEKVVLAAVLQDLQVNSYDDFSAYRYGNDSNISDMLAYLSDDRIITPSPHNIPEDFNDFDLQEGKFNFDVMQISWALDVTEKGLNDSQILKKAKYPQFSISLEKVPNILFYREIVTNVLENYLSDSFSLLIEKDDSFFSAVNIWLEDYTPREIQKAADSFKLDFFKMMNLAKSESGIIGVVDEITNRLALPEAKKAKKINNDLYDIRKLDNGLTRVFFTQLLDMPDWFNKLVPNPPESAKRMPPFMLDMLLDNIETDLTKINGIIKNVQSYSITEVGVCLNYSKSKTKLITDELSAYRFMKEKGKIINDNEWWSIEDLGFQVDNFYSLEFILKLIKKLRQKGISEVLQKI
ncbi:hypothetical protein [Companilactobacillus futsaii]|uniref:Uncharacterized protein n=2 Tax=Companilactobacillus futsaii TaxID=938155 RepID=A0A5B7T558_9LACO|nr:hypothetical protein [Companilactobacillus futsaii]KRK96836.1 hypothetical protein FC88_GL001921 [Companilactobacillus futsaii JCM 17355]QCX25679.1 hypothetical protein FG051_11505 [Companilactobacillus futsaii]